MRAFCYQIGLIKINALCMIKVHDEHMNNKLLAILNNPAPVIIEAQMKAKLK